MRRSRDPAAYKGTENVTPGELIYLVWNDLVGLSRTRGVPAAEYERRKDHRPALRGQSLRRLLGTTSRRNTVNLTNATCTLPVLEPCKGAQPHILYVMYDIATDHA